MNLLNLQGVKSLRPINLGLTKKRNRWTTKLAIEKIKANHTKLSLKLPVKGIVNES